MSFENIDYQEVYDCDNWTDSRLYEIFSNRFLFVVYKATGNIIHHLEGEEKEYVLDDVFFWTMPQDDLSLAEKYWNDITSGVRFIGMDDTIEIWTTDSDMPLMNSQEFAEKLTKVMTPEEK